MEINILAENTNQIALCQAMIQTCRKHVGAVLVFVVPRGLVFEVVLQLQIVDALNLAHNVHVCFGLGFERAT
jgi:hypothetical protein